MRGARAICGASASRQSRWAPCGPGREPINQRRMGDQHAGAGILEHEGKAFGWILGIERQIGAAGLEDAEQPHHHLERALDAQTHDGLGADAEPAQMMRQLVGARIELRIGEAAAARTPPRPRRGCAPTWAANSSGRLAGASAWAVSFQLAQDGVALVRAENVQAADRQVGRRNRRLQQADKPAPEGFDAVRARTGRCDSRAATAAALPVPPSGPRDNARHRARRHRRDAARQPPAVKPPRSTG